MDREVQAVIELLTMLLFDPRTGLLIILLAIAAWFDWRSQRIPNALTFGGAILGLLVNSLSPSTDVAPWLWSLAGLAAGLAVFLPLYLLRAMGAADVKLMAMIGVFLGFPDTLNAVLATLLAGGLMALMHAASRGLLRPMVHNIGILLRNTWLSLESPPASVGKLPYGLAIAGGTTSYLILQQLGFL